MLKIIRRTIAAIVGLAMLLMFLDFTGTIHNWFAWLAKIQLLPAILAVNIGVIIMLVVLTFLLGRIYCSVICPLGITQDFIARIGRVRRKNPYSFSKPKNWLRYSVLALTIVGLLTSVAIIVEFLAPYSTFGRIVTTLFQPVYILGNNLLASVSESWDSYAFYKKELWIESGILIAVTAAHLLIIAVLAWRNGRTYCNTICPVGTLLGFISRFSLCKVKIDETKCRKCGKCSKNCKAACIDSKKMTIDYSRCVVCGNCLENCSFGALSFGLKKVASVAQAPVSEAPATAEKAPVSEASASEEKVDKSKRAFLLSTALATTAAAFAEDKIKLDGGLAKIEGKQSPKRKTPITPPGSLSAQNLAKHCTACQLCISECPNNVLRPSTSLDNFMQPVMSYDRGYCRLECTRCSEVCPTSAIREIEKEERTAVQVGHAVLLKKNCISATDGVSCGNCARHCPVQAIEMVQTDPDDEKSPKIPAIDENKCIGCGACENLCPVRPFSAIYVEGHEKHSEA